MYRQSVLITNPTGLHARPATQLVELCTRFESQITMECDGVAVDPKSIFSVLGGKLKAGKTVAVDADGADAKEAVNTVCEFIRSLEG